MDAVVSYLRSTMLIERIFGVGIYVIVLCYFYLRVQSAKSAESIKRYLNHYLIVLCIMAFFYIPSSTADLFRWRLLAEPWKKASFSWFLKNRLATNATPLGYLLVYLCQITGINGLLPMFSALGFFGNLFHIISREAVREKRNPDSVAVTLLYVMSSGVFLEVISGIRCMLAFSIVLRFVYDEMYEGKSLLRSLPFYLIAVLLHNAAIPLIGIRLICSIFEKRKSVFLTITNIIVAVSTFVLAVKLGNDYIDAAFAKADTYTSHNVYSNIWEYIIASLGLLLLSGCLLSFRKRYPEGWTNAKKSTRYFFIILVGLILFLGTYSIFHRFFIACIIISAPVIMAFLDLEHMNERRRSRQLIVLISILILFIACTRGNLCGYKFFLLD